MSVVSVGVATAMLRDDELLVSAWRQSSTSGRGSAPGCPPPVGTSIRRVTNFILVEFASGEEADRVAEGLLSRGLIPRTFPDGHPLAHGLRLTVRNREQDDRLIEAAEALGRPDA